MSVMSAGKLAVVLLVLQLTLYRVMRIAHPPVPCAGGRSNLLAGCSAARCSSLRVGGVASTGSVPSQTLMIRAKMLGVMFLTLRRDRHSSTRLARVDGRMTRCAGHM